MAQGTQELFDQVGPFIKKWWGIGRKKVETQYSKIFNVGDTKEPVKDVREYGGQGVASLKTEGAPIYVDRVVQGVAKRFMAATYAISTHISHELLKDSKYGDLKRAIQENGASMEQTPEYLCGLFLDRAFNSSYPALGDGIELCATNHTLPKGSTYANELATPASLGETGLEQVMVNLRTMPKTDGMLRPLKAKKLLVPSALTFTAEKLSRTTKQVGSANNTVSVVAGIDVITFDYLTSGVRWFVLTDQNDADNGLFFDYRERPANASENKVETLTVLYAAWFRAMWGCIDGRAIYGSAATA